MARSLLLHTAHPCIHFLARGSGLSGCRRLCALLRPNHAESLQHSLRGGQRPLMWQLPVGRRLSPPRAIAIPTRRSRWPGIRVQGVRCYRLAHFLLLHGALNLIHLTHAPPLPLLSQALLRVDAAVPRWRACAVP